MTNVCSLSTGYSAMSMDAAQILSNDAHGAFMWKVGETVMGETRPKHKVEFIESYWTGGELGSDYQWNDNHGELIRCKDCDHNGKVEKCMLAAIAAEKDYPLFILDNRGEWFCADGKRMETDDSEADK